MLKMLFVVIMVFMMSAVGAAEVELNFTPFTAADCVNDDPAKKCVVIANCTIGNEVHEAISVVRSHKGTLVSTIDVKPGERVRCMLIAKHKPSGKMSAWSTPVEFIVPRVVSDNGKISIPVLTSVTVTR